jgi:PAS domain-containing protein
VGDSEGRFADGVGEVLDLKAALEWLRDQLGPDVPLGLVGYSFGSLVAARHVAMQATPPVTALALIAFTIRWPLFRPADYFGLGDYGGAILTICGNRDDLAPTRCRPRLFLPTGGHARSRVGHHPRWGRSQLFRLHPVGRAGGCRFYAGDVRGATGGRALNGVVAPSPLSGQFHLALSCAKIRSASYVYPHSAARREMHPMRSSRGLGPELWRAIVEKMDEGVIVLSSQGVVIYANDEAARLLDYSPRDVLALDVDDLIALCQPDRLDVTRFAATLSQGLLPEQPDQVFDLVTLRRRLQAAPFVLPLESERIIVILLREDVSWRSDLVAHTVMTEMEGPLDSAIRYSDTLMRRIGSPDAQQAELTEFTRIIRNSAGRAQALWETLHRLYITDPRQTPHLAYEPVQLAQAIRAALQELKARALHGLPTLRLNLPGDLPRVRASADHLHAALVALLEETMSRLTDRDELAITARNKGTYVQVDLVVGRSSGALRGYLFDVLPLSIVEQVILQHGGRIWLEAGHGAPFSFSFSIPIWPEKG